MKKSYDNPNYTRVNLKNGEKFIITRYSKEVNDIITAPYFQVWHLEPSGAHLLASFNTKEQAYEYIRQY